LDGWEFSLSEASLTGDSFSTSEERRRFAIFSEFEFDFSELEWFFDIVQEKLLAYRGTLIISPTYLYPIWI